MALLPIATILLAAAGWDPPEAAVLVDGTAGNAALVMVLTSDLAAAGVRVATESEIQATMKWRGRSRPDLDRQIVAFRGELDVDRLVHVATVPGEGDAVAFQVRVADRATSGELALRSYGEVRDASELIPAVRALLSKIAPLPRAAVDLTDLPKPRVARSSKIVLPTYPPRGTPKYASIKLEILVDESGRVRDVRQLEGNAVYLEAAAQAMSRTRFEHYLVDGEPRSWRSLLPMNIRTYGSADPNARFMGKGDHEVGIEAGVASGDVYLSTDNGRHHSQSRNAVLEGNAGFFLADDIELFATLYLEYPMATSRISGQGAGLGLGLAWLPEIAPSAHAGPIFSAGYAWREGKRTTDEGSSTFFVGDGTFVFGGIAARTRIRPGLGFGFELGGYWESFAIGESGATTGGGYGSETGFRISLSIASMR